MRPCKTQTLGRVTDLAMMVSCLFALLALSAPSARSNEADVRKHILKIEYCLPREQAELAGLCPVSQDLAKYPQIQSMCRNWRKSFDQRSRTASLFVTRIPYSDNASMTEVLLAKSEGERDYQKCFTKNACVDSCNAAFPNTSTIRQLVLCSTKCRPEGCKHNIETCSDIKEALPY